MEYKKAQIKILDKDHKLYADLVNKEHFLSSALKIFHANPQLRRAYFKNQDSSHLSQLLKQNKSDSHENINQLTVQKKESVVDEIHINQTTQQEQTPKRGW